MDVYPNGFFPTWMFTHMEFSSEGSLPTKSFSPRGFTYIEFSLIYKTMTSSAKAPWASEAIERDSELSCRAQQG